LRRATRDLINWIESLKSEKAFDFHLVSNLDGTKGNVPRKSYVPFPEDEQPHLVFDEEKVVKMVKKSFGSRPALTFRVAVRDVDHLPEELEKFDNFHYVEQKVMGGNSPRNSKVANDLERHWEADTSPQRDFGLHSGRPESRRIRAVGTLFDTKTRRPCRYGTWYLDRSLWRKMDATEELSEQASKERRPPAAMTSDVSHLHSVKEFYKNLKKNGRPIPTWMRLCEGPLPQTEIEEASGTAPLGIQVCQMGSGRPLMNLLNFDSQSSDAGHRKSGFLERKEEVAFVPNLNSEFYDFLEKLEQGLCHPKK
jgi:hypothetical protein